MKEITAWLLALLAALTLYGSIKELKKESTLAAAFTVVSKDVENAGEIIGLQQKASESMAKTIVLQSMELEYLRDYKREHEERHRGETLVSN